MRCRVGRKPTSRSMVRTSCHGQPLRSVRRGSAEKSAPASIARETTMVRVEGIEVLTPVQNSSKSLRMKSYRLCASDATLSQLARGWATPPRGIAGRAFAGLFFRCYDRYVTVQVEA